MQRKWRKLSYPWEFEIFILSIIIGFVFYASYTERLQGEAKDEEKAQITQRAYNQLDSENAKPRNAWQPIEINKDGTPVTPTKTPEEQAELLSDAEFELLFADLGFVRGMANGMTRNAWFLMFVFAYFAHLALCRIAPNFVSTSIWMILSPLAFSFLGYGYLLCSYIWAGRPGNVFQGAAWELILILVFVLILAVLLARVRMQRVAINLKGTHWDMEVSARDATNNKLAVYARIDPIFYRPRSYKLCSEGILIEGWNYVIPVPFEQTKSIRKRDKGDFSSAGFHAVRTLDNLILLDILFSKEPILIAPEKETIFLDKAKERLAEFKARNYHQSPRKTPAS